MEKATEQKGRLIIVSNRMPMTVGIEDGEMKTGPSAGGLVSALGAFLERRKAQGVELSEHKWIGWPGNSIAPQYHDLVKSRLRQMGECEPVFIEEQLMDQFYLGKH